MSKSMITWFPTLKCNLSCQCCISKSKPVVTHGNIRTSKEWNSVWEKCPLDVGSLIITGGEPSLFPDLNVSLCGDKFSSIHLNTNLIKDPKLWWKNDLMNVNTVCIGWHLSLDHPLSRVIWDHIKWVIDNRIDIKNPTNLTLCHPIDPQLSVSSENKELKERCLSLGINYWSLNYYDVWQWRDWIPLRKGRALSCSGGRDRVVILPDGSGYRCLCQPYALVEPFTNFITDGWGKIKIESEPCDYLVCSNYAECDKVTVVYESGSIQDFVNKKPDEV